MRSSWVLLVVLHVAVFISTGTCAEQTCTFQIEKDRDFVLVGEKAQLNCTSNCLQVFWETRQTKVAQDRSNGFTSLQVLINDYADSPIECQAIGDDNELYKDVTRVEAYALPSKVDIEMNEELEEDKEHEVTCLVYDVAPVKNVILSVSRGGEPFLNQTYEADTRRGPQNLNRTFRFSAKRSDSGLNFTCLVTLNLTRVPNTTVQSAPVTVRTFALPENPRITAEKWLEQGTVTDINCNVFNAFPEENVKTQLFIENIPDLSKSGNGAVLYSLNTSDLAPAHYNVVCIAEVFIISKRADKSIIVYEPPKMNLNVPSKVVTLNETVTLNCELVQGNAEYFGLAINSGKRIKANVANLTEEITVTKREPTLSVTCETFIAENDKVLLRSEEILTVHYPPSPPKVNISTANTSPGASVSLTCHSEAHPSPTYSWVTPPNAEVDFSVDKSSIIIREATTNHHGTYTCTVENDYGQLSRSQDLEVKNDHRLWIALVSVGAGIVAVTLVGFAIYYFLQNGKKGFYDLVRRKHKSPDNSGIPLHENGKC